jgi:hypothetical protein
MTESLAVPIPSSNSMAYGADDLALRELVKESLLRRAQPGAAREAEPLARRVEVVEVHLVRGKRA